MSHGYSSPGLQSRFRWIMGSTAGKSVITHRAPSAAQNKPTSPAHRRVKLPSNLISYPCPHPARELSVCRPALPSYRVRTRNRQLRYPCPSNPGAAGSPRALTLYNGRAEWQLAIIGTCGRFTRSQRRCAIPDTPRCLADNREGTLEALGAVTRILFFLWRLSRQHSV